MLNKAIEEAFELGAFAKQKGMNFIDNPYIVADDESFDFKRHMAWIYGFKDLPIDKLEQRIGEL